MSREVSVAMGLGKLAVASAAAVAALLAWNDYSQFQGLSPDSSADSNLPRYRELAARLGPNPAEFTIAPALETIGDYRLLFDWQRDAAGYESVIARAEPRGFPDDRIATERGYDETPTGLDRQQNEKLRLSDLVIFHDDGQLELLPCTRAQVYHSQFKVGSLPLAKLHGARFITLEIEYKIPRDAARMANLANVGTYAMRLKLIWCNAVGEPIFKDTRSHSYLKLETMGGPDWMTDRIQDVAVPAEAEAVRLDWQLPSLERTLVRVCRVLGAALERRESNAMVQRTTGGDRAAATVSFPPASLATGQITGQGVEIRIPGISAAKSISRDHTLSPLSAGQRTLIGNLLPQALLLTDLAGRALTLNIAGADLLSVKLGEGELLVSAFTYSAAERSYRVYSDLDPRGLRIVRDLALTQSLPPASLHIALDRGEMLLFPSWQQRNSLATLIFTEHADRQSQATDQLVMYGNPEGVYTEGSGILGLHIPVSKTIFTAGFNSGTAPSAPPGAAVWGTMAEPGFNAYIRRLMMGDHRIELGLHSAGSATDSIETTIAGLEILRSLGGDLWIDHGDQYNLDDLCRLGWDPSRPDYYVIPALRRAGVRYAWTYRDVGGEGLNCIQDGEPSNLLFQLPRLDDDPEDDWHLTWFGTRRLEFKRDLFANGPLDALINQRGLCIVHCYLSYNRFGHIIMEGENPVGLADWFVRDLEEIARRRDEGDLAISTIGEWADHALAMRRVSVTPRGLGRYQVDNGAGKAIPGATFALVAAPSGSVSARTAEGGAVTVRPADGAWYLALDLPAGRTELVIEPSPAP